MPARDYYLPSRRLVSHDEAAIVERADVPRSSFRNSWTRKTAFDAGLLVPILIDEILPGDHMKYDINAYVRLSTPLFPILDNQRIDTFFFFVPARLLWDNWPKFMGEQDNPEDSIDYTIPTVAITDAQATVGSIWDHMGIPTQGQFAAAVTGAILNLNALPLRAYNLIYNQWFRDENLQQSLMVRKTDAGEDADDYSLVYRNKFHDYFTSALPWPQKFTAPTVPVAGMAPVTGIGSQNSNMGTISTISVRESDQQLHDYDAYKNTWDLPDRPTAEFVMKMADGNWPAVFADLSQATGVAINTFRQAFLIQQLLERDARGGTRYTEKIWSHFGVRNPDFRLQRPEYIGGGSTPLQITPVAQTAPTASLTVGALGAAGTAAGRHNASYAATEHGYILGLINVRTELSYQQGLHKMWTRETQYDFYVPSLAGLGEQAILRKEIYFTGLPANDEVVFGYQERWHEYRTRVSEVTGIMRSTATSTLDAWHLAQKFLTPPTLSAAWIEDFPPVARILAAGTQANNQQYYADILFERTAVRAIPTFGTPVKLGRF